MGKFQAVICNLTSSTSSCSSSQQDFIFDPLDANKQAFIECIKVIEANIEDIIIRCNLPKHNGYGTF
ncbi:unnamed protein product [Rhizophagus irregularis]|nr:unnamed protein product [Rhizophagus irregularis]